MSKVTGSIVLTKVKVTDDAVLFMKPGRKPFAYFREIIIIFLPMCASSIPPNIEHFGVSPDVLVASKGLSGGIFPMSITSFTGELEKVFYQDPFLHVSSFGGGEAGCLVALKVLEITSEPFFLEHVNCLAELFSRGLQDLQEKHSHFLAGFRQLGLMIGLETPNEKCGPLLTRACYENGILSIYAGHDNSINSLLPPLNIDPSTAEEILERLDSALKDAARFYRESAK